MTEKTTSRKKKADEKPHEDVQEQEGKPEAVEAEVVPAEEEKDPVDAIEVYQANVTRAMTPTEAQGHYTAMRGLAEGVVRSGRFPQHNNADAVAVVILAGAEEGKGPMESLMDFALIKGKICRSPESMRSDILKKCNGSQVEVIEATAERCILIGRRPGQPEMEVSFTMEEAKNAGLVKTDSAWTTYPSDMLVARATSRLGRRLFPDVFRGSCYTPEELNSEQQAALPQPDVSAHARTTTSRENRAKAKEGAQPTPSRAAQEAWELWLIQARAYWGTNMPQADCETAWFAYIESVIGVKSAPANLTPEQIEQVKKDLAERVSAQPKPAKEGGA